MSSKKSLEERLSKTEEILRENLNTVRAGRANPALLDKVNVDYYVFSFVSLYNFYVK